MLSNPATWVCRFSNEILSLFSVIKIFFGKIEQSKSLYLTEDSEGCLLIVIVSIEPTGSIVPIPFKKISKIFKCMGYTTHLFGGFIRRILQNRSKCYYLNEHQKEIEDLKLSLKRIF